MEYAKNNTWLTGLFITCPAGIRTDNCPCTEFEQLPLVEKVIASTEMNDDERNRIVKHHKDCLRKRETDASI